MIKFPYGQSDFYSIITEESYYCDRTGTIPALEQAKSQLFIRPRRFGKSLLLSMLENYYDIAKKDEFERLFGHLAIGEESTKLRNSYLILRLDFSCVDPTGSTKNIKKSLYNHVNSCIEEFIKNYNKFIDTSDIKINYNDALYSLKSLTSSAKSLGVPIYLLIDEYDAPFVANFANTVMMQPFKDSAQRYKALVHEEGPLRTLFKVIKSLTGGNMIDRVFITGVSPMVMSDITSGYNVAEDIFFEPEFGSLCGFKEYEVEKTLKDIARECGLPPDKACEALCMMRTWYNGYVFTPWDMGPDLTSQRVYNPTLCLYFFKQFQKRREFPSEMLDANLSTDEDKLEYIARLSDGDEMILSLTEKNAYLTVPKLNKRFGLSEMLGDVSQDRNFLASYLYFFGILTLAGNTAELKLKLKIPNLVTQSLYINNIITSLLPVPTRRTAGRDAAELVYQKGDIAPLCAFVEKHLLQVLSNRDYSQASELTIKTAFLALLYNDILYIMDSEPELRHGYADLTMIIRPDMRHGKIFDVLIEFKFVGLKSLKLTGREVKEMEEKELYNLPAVNQALEEGKKQAEDYDRSLEEKYGNLRLKKFVLVAVGFERICFVNADGF